MVDYHIERVKSPSRWLANPPNLTTIIGRGTPILVVAGGIKAEGQGVEGHSG